MKRLCILLAAVAFLVPLPRVFSMPIEDVEVQVVDTNNGTSEPLLAKMNSSMKVVAEQLLVGKDTGNLQASIGDYSRLFTEIGDRVFTGYELQDVSLALDSKTKVFVKLRPWTDTINTVNVDLQFSGLHPSTAAMLKKRLPGLEKDLENIVSGASIDAVDWAGGILRKQVREQIEQTLPEFKAAVDLVHDEKNNSAIIQVVVFPIGDNVRNVRYEMHSESIPNLLLMELKYAYLKRCDELRGLPVSYIKRHKQELESIIVEEIKKEKIIKELDLTPIVEIIPEADLGVDISLKTNKFKIWLEGYADIGRRKDNLSGKAHLGKFVSKRDELFVEEELVTDNVHWSTSLGWGRKWDKSTWSYRRRIPESDNVYKLEYSIGPKWNLRAEHYSGSNRNEYAVRYRIHEFLSAEYVYGGKESYLRIIGNL